MENSFITNKDLKHESKIFKKDVGKAARTLLLYQLLMYVVVIVYTGIVFAENYNLKGEELEKIISKTMESGIPYIVTILFGFSIILLYRKKELFTNDLIVTNNKMNKNAFVKLLICFMGTQILFIICDVVFEGIFNLFGYTLSSQIEAATSTSTTMSMFIYASFLGPIAEELIFRGAILRSLEKYGTNFSIILSSIMFGFFHGNLTQGIFAFCIGLILGYVTVEYSLKWAILLHIINNFVFGDLLGILFENVNETVGNIISFGILVIFFIVGIIIVIKNRVGIKEYIVKSKGKWKVRHALASIWILIFLLLNFLLTILGIEKLPS